MRNFFKNITLIFSVTFILIISIDLILGNKIINFFFSNDKSVKHSIYHHDLDKNLNEKIIYNNVYEHSICTNNYGFKSSCIDKEKISKSVDYAFIGDSFTEGVGLNYAETFIGKFKNKKKNDQIINLGVGSYSPKIYFKKLEHYLNQGFTFDRVIVFIDVGDIFDENRYFINSKGTVTAKSDLKFINTVYQDYSELYKLKKFLKQLLPLTSIFYSQIMSVKLNLNKKVNVSNDKREIQDNYLINSRWTYKNKFSKKDQIWIDKGREDAVFFMNKIFELSKINNFKLSLAVYPWPAQILHDKDTGRTELGKFWENYCKNKCESFINYLDYFHQLKQEIEKEKIVELYYLKNDVHFNQKGNDIILKKLLETFK